MVSSIFFISAAILAYEIILMRIFSITQWHHFAYMIISIALLGFGASGTVISLFRSRLQQHFQTYFRLFAGLFPGAILVSYVLSQQNPFNPFEIVWDAKQLLHLSLYYIVLFLPFFFGAICIGLMFSQYTSQIGRLYCYNLVGSGIGALGAIICLYIVHPVHALYIITGLALWGWVTAFAHENQYRTRLLRLLVCGCLFAITILAVTYDPLALRAHLNISPYKGFSQARHFPDAEILSESVSPLGVIHTISSPIIRNAPGLSWNYSGQVPSQIGIFIDAGEAGTIIADSDVEYLDFLTSSLAYHVRPVSHALVLGAGGGMDVVNALFHRAETVDAVELNPQIIDLVRGPFREVGADLYGRSNVRIINQEARSYIEATPSSYDLIQISLLDSFSTSSAGGYALHENYLYTVEALKQYYSRLGHNGILTITRWVKFPPRDNIKLFATAIEALEQSGVAGAAQHLVSIRSWATCTLLVSTIPFTSEEIQHIQQFCQERSFDTNYFPGITPEQANIYNQNPSPEYYRAAQALLFGDRATFYESYPYFVRPATDNSPYFFHFFTWKSFPTLLRTMGKEWIPFIEWGYVVILATLIQVLILSALLIVLPLRFLRRGHTRIQDKLQTLIYFTCLGLGYLFLEIVFIQKFVVFLGNPVYAVSVVVAAFLIFSGCGSFYFEARRTKHEGRDMKNETQGKHILNIAILGIVGFSLIYTFLLPLLFASCATWSTWIKISLTLICIAPLAVCMGIPFPYGLTRLAFLADELIPWAYAINGYASVVSSLIATCIAIAYGFHLVLLLASGLYVVAVGTLWLTSHPSPSYEKR